MLLETVDAHHVIETDNSFESSDIETTHNGQYSHTCGPHPFQRQIKQVIVMKVRTGSHAGDLHQDTVGV
jgi:hypothetical protein